MVAGASNSGTYVSQAKWNKPVPRPNIMPSLQGWLRYNWIDKDPELEYVIACIGNSGRSPEWIEKETEAHGHRVSRNTILNWCYGDTKRPQNVTVSTVMAVLGYNKVWVQE